VSKIGASLSAAPIPQTHEYVHAVRIQQWLCFVDNVSSRTKVMQCPRLIVKIILVVKVFDD